ncbi:hypothetical protein JW752_04810 [Candidatus Peregrinibacteria bacterium]|nr:hypothetical protein [Candidatus Peregrinibacteria bacterium]
MAVHDKKQGQTDGVIPFPDDRRSAPRQCLGRPAIEIVEEESVIPVDSLSLADARLQLHQGEILITTIRDDALEVLKEAGHLRDEQVEIDPETGDCFILADDGERMELAKYIKYVGQKRLEEETDKHRKRVSEETD